MDVAVRKNPKTAQYSLRVVQAPHGECQLYNRLRLLESDVADLNVLDDHSRLTPKTRVTFHMEDRISRDYFVDTKDIVYGVACESIDYIEAVLNDRTQAKELAAAIEDRVQEDAPATHDRESVLGTQNTTEGQLDHHPAPNVWKSFRETSIPAAVSDVIFKVTGEESDDLRCRFPGVTLMYTPAITTESEREELDKPQQPPGIKDMILELNEDEIAQNPALEDEIREKYPWATIRSKPGPDTSCDGSAADGVDPIRHMGDLVAFSNAPLSTKEFDVYNRETFENWDKLPSAHKLEVAHARAIQTHYGARVDGGGCGHCVQEGYKCRSYAPELHTRSTMSLGLECQNCRMKNIKCDLVDTTDDHPAETPPRSESAEGSQHSGDDTNVSTAPTTPTMVVARKPLVSRITYPGNELRIRGAAAARADDEEASSSVTSEITVPTDAITTSGAPDSIVPFADSIGLDIHIHAQRTIHAMYERLRSNRKVKVLAPKATEIQVGRYYNNLITLYVLLCHREEDDLAYIVLLRFQNTNFTHSNHLPAVDTVVRAFELLPPNSPLCRWLACLYSYLWPTQRFGNYQEFTRSCPDLNDSALVKLLYAIAFERDPHTKGLNRAVIDRWCSVHDHEQQSSEQSLCDIHLEGLKMCHPKLFIEDSIKKENGNQSSPASKGKRKAESLPGRPRKKGKRGGGYGQDGR